GVSAAETLKLMSLGLGMAAFRFFRPDGKIGAFKVAGKETTLKVPSDLIPLDMMFIAGDTALKAGQAALLGRHDLWFDVGSRALALVGISRTPVFRNENSVFAVENWVPKLLGLQGKTSPPQATTPVQTEQFAAPAASIISTADLARLPASRQS